MPPISTELFWYKVSKALSYNKLFSFLIGGRGIGKTFDVMTMCINRFIKTGEQFIWVRRTEVECDVVAPKFFNAIVAENIFPNTKFEVKGRTLYINGSIAGYIIALSTASKFKSVSYPRVNKMVYDEFLIEKGSGTYLKREVEAFLAFYETVFRLREGKAIFLANAVSVSNPYFDYFKIKPNPHTEFTCYDNMLIQVIRSENFMNAKEKTAFGQIIANTSYGDYMVKNKFLLDNNTFIEKLRKNANYFFTLFINGNKYAVHYEPLAGLYYVDKNINTSCNYKFYYSPEDLQPNATLISMAKNNTSLKRLKFAIETSQARFDSISTRSDVFEVFNLI